MAASADRETRLEAALVAAHAFIDDATDARYDPFEREGTIDRHERASALATEARRLRDAAMTDDGNAA